MLKIGIFIFKFLGPRGTSFNLSEQENVINLVWEGVLQVSIVALSLDKVPDFFQQREL